MSGENENEASDKKHDDYLAERSFLNEAERESSRLFDKAILTLAGGSFGLSFAFIKQVVPQIKIGTTVWLVLGWGGFCLSLLSTLISFLTSQAALRRQREILENDYFRNGGAETNRPGELTNCLNLFSIMFFVLGTIFLAVFVLANISC